MPSGSGDNAGARGARPRRFRLFRHHRAPARAGHHEPRPRSRASWPPRMGLGEAHSTGSETRLGTAGRRAVAALAGPPSVESVSVDRSGARLHRRPVVPARSFPVRSDAAGPRSHGDPVLSHHLRAQSGGDRKMFHRAVNAVDRYCPLRTSPVCLERLAARAGGHLQRTPRRDMPGGTDGNRPLPGSNVRRVAVASARLRPCSPRLPAVGAPATVLLRMESSPSAQ
jgi:hypothetical protein